MKKIWSIVMVVILILSFTQDASANWRGRYHGGWGGYYRPAPAAYYRPYCAPVPVPVFQDRWVQPHYRRTPYGDQFIPAHWTRVRVY